MYYRFFKTFYTVYSALNGAQVFQFREDVFAIFKKSWPWLIVFSIPPFLILFLKDRMLFCLRPRFKSFLFLILLIILINGIGLTGITLGDKGPNSPYDLYSRSGNPFLTAQRLGLLTNMRLEIQNIIFKNNSPILAAFAHYIEDSAPVDNSSDDYIHEIEVIPEDPDIPPESEHLISTEEEQKKDIQRNPNILDIDFPNLIANESDQDISAMHEYFKNVAPTYTNEYTGKYEGYNLIFITAESFSHYGVHKDITPTLYKLVHEGYHFTNFYNPIWGVSTTDGEYVACTGLIPKPGVWSFYKSANISLPFVMGHQLKDMGYKTVAYHNHSYDYYRRDISHPNMGYDYKGIGNGLIMTDSWPRSDLEMMEKTIPEYIDDTPFHAYYMTVSGHMQYNFTGNYMAMKNKEYVKDLPYTEAGKAYIATHVELDKAMEYLLQELERAGIADKTLIALSADHYPYGLEKDELDDLAGHEVEEIFELYKSNFILYTKDMEPVTIDKPCSSLDIIPTLSNLLGLSYDSRLLMGRDIFSDSEPLVIFQDRSFITDKGKYNAIDRKFIANENVRIDSEYIQNIVNIIEEKFEYSAKILDNDYYNRILGE
ncbi:MAG: LTA synthase family protein [Clostridiales bacterium]|nr:LTA synthase family protein [Clostridiales bacterium]